MNSSVQKESAKSLDQKKLQIRILEALQRRRREAPLLFYKPHEWQRKFHDAGKTHRRRMVRAGNRWGKSHAGAYEALAHAYGYRFWEVPDLELVDGDLPPRDRVDTKHWIFNFAGTPIRVPNEGIVITGLATTRGIGQVIWPKINDALPPELLREKRVRTTLGSNSVPSKVFLANGSIIHTGSAEQDRAQFEGFAVDWAWVDEPIPRWLYNGLWRALSDYMGPIWFTLTPLGYRPWLKELSKADGVWSVQRPQRDNVYMPEEAFKEFESDGMFSERERAARLFGEFEFVGNNVFTIDPEVHFVKPFEIPEHWIIGQTVDPHHRKPAFILWWAIDPETEPNWVWHFFREWPVEDYFRLEGGALAPSEYAALFRNIEGGRPSETRICDPRFGKAEWLPAGTKQRTVWVEEMAKAGLYYDCNIQGLARLEIGHMKITNLLQYDSNYPISASNTPHILIHDTCENTKKALLNYAYIEVKDETKGTIEKVSEEFKDPIDCIRYTILYNIPMMNVQKWVGEQFDEEALEDWDE